MNPKPSVDHPVTSAPMPEPRRLKPETNPKHSESCRCLSSTNPPNPPSPLSRTNKSPAGHRFGPQAIQRFKLGEKVLPRPSMLQWHRWGSLSSLGIVFSRCLQEAFPILPLLLLPRRRLPTTLAARATPTAATATAVTTRFNTCTHSVAGAVTTWRETIINSRTLMTLKPEPDR